MNRGVEFHDSEVRLIEHPQGSVRMFFEPAYIHVSNGRPGVDSGEGHVQAAELVFETATCDEIPPECSGALSDGAVTVDGVSYSLLPVPFIATGEVSAYFIFCTGAILKLSAKSVLCTVYGPSRFIETFAA